MIGYGDISWYDLDMESFRNQTVSANNTIELCLLRVSHSLRENCSPRKSWKCWLQFERHNNDHNEFSHVGKSTRIKRLICSRNRATFVALEATENGTRLERRLWHVTGNICCFLCSSSSGSLVSSPSFCSIFFY